jgi:hypothetical protein
MFLTFSRTKFILGLSCGRISRPVFVPGQLSSFNILSRSISGNNKRPFSGKKEKNKNFGEKRSISATQKVSKEPNDTDSLFAPIDKLLDRIEVKI